MCVLYPPCLSMMFATHTHTHTHGGGTHTHVHITRTSFPIHSLVHTFLLTRNTRVSIHDHSRTLTRAHTRTRSPDYTYYRPTLCTDSCRSIRGKWGRLFAMPSWSMRAPNRQHPAVASSGPCTWRRVYIVHIQCSDIITMRHEFLHIPET